MSDLHFVITEGEPKEEDFQNLSKGFFRIILVKGTKKRGKNFVFS